MIKIPISIYPWRRQSWNKVWEHDPLCSLPSDKLKWIYRRDPKLCIHFTELFGRESQKYTCVAVWSTGTFTQLFYTVVIYTGNKRDFDCGRASWVIARVEQYKTNIFKFQICRQIRLIVLKIFSSNTTTPLIVYQS